MTLILDAGAMIALERGHHGMWGELLAAQKAGTAVRTSSVVVAQTWRDGPKQARLAMALRSISEVPLDQDRSRRVGQLLASSRTSDIADAAVVELARDEDKIVTSDLDDIEHLAAIARRRVSIVKP